MEDQEIIRLYWDRSQQAITESDRKYGRYCHTIAHNILRSVQDSEECVNDTWLQTWRTIPPQRPAFLKAFVGTITRNLALNRYEKQHAAKRGSGETQVCMEELDECIPDQRRTEAAVERIALTACLNEFLGGLGEEERKIFVKRYWYMCSVKEIAEQMQIGESKVKMSLLRNRGKLRGILEKEGIDV